MSIQTYDSPPGVAVSADFIIDVQLAARSSSQPWSRVPAYAVDVANVNITSNTFNHRTVGLASFDLDGPVRIQVTYTGGAIDSAMIRPFSLGICVQVQGNTITFTLDEAHDVMLELNGNKWTALHLLTNKIDPVAPRDGADNIWFFGPGINNSSACAKAADGINLWVPSGTTVYLAGGAFITFRLNFINVSHSAVRGHGFILGPKGGYAHRELGVTNDTVCNFARGCK